MDLEQSESKDSNKDKERYLRVLMSGSVREKTIMVFNNLADIRDGKDGFLTKEEMDALVNSFKSNKEIDMYTKYQSLFRSIDQFLLIISQCRFTYLGALHKLDKLLVLKKGYNDLQQAANILLEFIPNIDSKRKAIIDIAENHVNPFNYKPHHITCLIGGIDDEDEKGNLIKEGSLKIFSNIDNYIGLIFDKVQTEQVRLKTAIHTLRYFMKEKKFIIKGIERHLKDIESWAKKDKDELIALKVNFNICEPVDISIREPKYKEMEIDKEQYNSFMEYLNGN